MSYHISVAALALNNMNSATQWYGEQAPDLGRRWRRGIEAAIDSLTENPDRCGLAHETDQFDFELRELLYGFGRKKTHRILFRITEDAVEILAVRHASQQDLSSGDV